MNRDPKIYPDPEEFKPERFNDEEQRSRHKHTLLTFGAGPRNCIGLRFVLLQTKIALVHIVKNFEIRSSPLQKPIVTDPKSVFVRYPKDGVKLQFEMR